MQGRGHSGDWASVLYRDAAAGAAASSHSAPGPALISPQEMQNFDEFVANIRVRGGAVRRPLCRPCRFKLTCLQVDLALSTDSMRCTIWCANAMPKRDGAADGTAGSGILPIQIMTVAAVGLVGVAFAVVQMVHV